MKRGASGAPTLQNSLSRVKSHPKSFNFLLEVWATLQIPQIFSWEVESPAGIWSVVFSAYLLLVRLICRLLTAYLMLILLFLGSPRQPLRAASGNRIDWFLGSHYPCPCLLHASANNR